MPKTAKQRRGEIVHALQHEDLITDAKLREALADVDIESPNGIKEYVTALEDLKYITRVPGGFKLTEESKKTGTITIRVTPKQNTANVAKGLTAALQQFKGIATMIIEA